MDDGSLLHIGIPLVFSVPDTTADPNREKADFRINALASALFYQFQQQIAKASNDSSKLLRTAGVDLVGQFRGGRYIPDVVTELRDNYLANPLITSVAGGGAAPRLEKQLTVLGLSAANITDLVELLLNNMRRNQAGGYIEGQLESDALSWISAVGLEKGGGGRVVYKEWHKVCGKITADALVRPEVVSKALESCISAAIYTIPLDQMPRGPSFLLRKRRTEKDKAAVRAFMVKHWTQPDNLDLLDNLDDTKGQIIWHSVPQALANPAIDLLPITTPALRNPVTQQNLIWKAFGEITHLKTKYIMGTPVDKLNFNNELSWILENLEIKPPVNPVSSRQDMIRRCKQILAAKVFSQRKAQVIAWCALDQLDVLDPSMGVFTRDQCTQILDWIASFIPQQLPYRWPWFPLSQEQAERTLTTRWFFENKSEVQSPLIARVAWRVPSIRNAFSVAPSGYMDNLFNGPPSMPIKILGVLGAAKQDASLYKILNETTKQMGARFGNENEPGERFAIYPVRAWQEWVYMLQQLPEPNARSDSILQRLIYLVESAAGAYFNVSIKDKDALFPRVNIQLLFNAISSAVSVLPPKPGVMNIDETDLLARYATGAAVFRNPLPGIMDLTTGKSVVENDAEAFRLLLQDPKQLQKIENDISVSVIPNPVDLERLANVGYFIKAMSMNSSLSHLLSIFENSCQQNRFADQQIAKTYDGCSILKQILVEVISRLDKYRRSVIPPSPIEQKAGRSLLMHFVGVLDMPLVQLQEIQRDLHPIRQKAMSQKVQNQIHTVKIKGALESHKPPSLLKGPGNANIIHPYNIDLYQEGFAYYRSTLLYYEKLDGLSVSSLMNEFETPLDKTKMGDTSDYKDMYNRVASFVSNELQILPGNPPTLAILKDQYKSIGLQSILNSQDQQYSMESWQLALEPIMFKLGVSIYRGSDYKPVTSVYKSPLFYVDDNLMRIKLDWIISMINLGSIVYNTGLGNGFRFAEIAGNIQAAIVSQCMKQVSVGGFLDISHQQNIEELSEILRKPLERLSMLQHKSRQFNVLYSCQHLIESYLMDDIPLLTKILGDSEQPIFVQPSALTANQTAEVSDFISLVGQPQAQSVLELETRLTTVKGNSLVAQFIAKSLVAHVLYRDIIAVLACIVGVYWNPKFDAEIAQIDAADTTDGYYSKRGVELPQAIYKVKQLGIDMSVKDAVTTANATGQLDKIVESILDPSTLRVIESVQSIWEAALVLIV